MSIYLSIYTSSNSWACAVPRSDTSTYFVLIGCIHSSSLVVRFACDVNVPVGLHVFKTPVQFSSRDVNEALASVTRGGSIERPHYSLQFG